MFGKIIIRSFLFIILIGAAYILFKAYTPEIASFLQNLKTNKNLSLPRNPVRPKSKDLVKNIYTILKSLDVNPDGITSQLFLEENTREIKATIPRGVPLALLIWQFTDATTRTDYDIADSYIVANQNTHHLIFISKRKEKIRLILSQDSRYLSGSVKMAVLINNFGFSAEKTTIDYLSFPDPLTVSLLPTETVSEWTAKIANHYKKEILISLPLEGYRASGKIKNTILLHYDDEKIKSLIHEAITCIPNFSGFCNYDGSRALEDSRVTKLVLGETKRRHGFFVQIGKIRKSLVAEKCRELQVPYQEVSKIISDKANEHSVDSLLTRAVITGRRTGQVIVCSPPTSAFIRTLTRKKDLLTENGVQLVYVSDILVHPDEM